MPGARNKLRINAWEVAATELVDEIVATAASIATAHAPTGERVFADDAESRLLRTIAGSPYCLAIAGAARAMRISRQAAHKLVYAAVARGRLELLPNPDDLRILQVFLTPSARAELARMRTAEGTWLQVLLGDLGGHNLKAVTRVLRVIRQRLQRDERDRGRGRAEREQRERERLSRDRFFR